MTSSEVEAHSQNNILREGDTCWRKARADKVCFLVDGANYFFAVREAFKKAKKNIFILGWDVNSQLELVKDGDHPGAYQAGDDDLPTKLGELLNTLAKQNPELNVYVLNWDYALVYAVDRESFSKIKLGWSSADNIYYQVDSCHPPGAAQHQKIVVVDDQLAFIGGIDLTLGRWDTQQHAPGDSRRDQVKGEACRPFHDIQVGVNGDAARVLARLVRQRWATATGETIDMLEPNETTPSLWPEGVEADAEQVEVGVARTFPAFKSQEEVREIEALMIESLKHAKHYIYLENQYLTADCVANILEEQLQKVGGPEVVITLPYETDGWLSQFTMDVIRERIIKRLREVDHENRLQVYFPHDPELEPQYMIVHAKVTLIDDCFARVGSANFNNRSMGLDTEADLAIEARGEGESSEKTAITVFRDRLLSEHLSVSPEAFHEAFESTGSLIKAIKQLQSDGHSLYKLPMKVTQDIDDLVPKGSFVDPEKAITPDDIVKQVIEDPNHKPLMSRVMLSVTLLAVFAGLAAAWRWTPLGQWLDVDMLKSSIQVITELWYGPLMMVGIFILGGFLAFPVTLLVAVTVLLFDPVSGAIYSMLGALASTGASYLAGHYLGGGTVEKLNGKKMDKLKLQLQKRGMLAVVFLRIVPVAPFTVINLAAGALHIKLKDLMVGTFIGLLPAILSIALFTDQLASLVEEPSLPTFAALAAAVGVILVIFWGVGRWLDRFSDTAKGNEADIEADDDSSTKSRINAGDRRA